MVASRPPWPNAAQVAGCEQFGAKLQAAMWQVCQDSAGWAIMGILGVGHKLPCMSSSA